MVYVLIERKNETSTPHEIGKGVERTEARVYNIEINKLMDNDGQDETKWRHRRKVQNNSFSLWNVGSSM